ncbi:agglutinin ssa-like protein [Stemphylium lycopersici]|nr:agglutinin ssa-like protein [Stemphylium lycopersici]
MSDWIGPNVYRIAGYADRKSAVTVKDGSKSESAEVVTKANETNQGDHWQFVHVGTGVSKKEEFVIINRYTGLYLTYTEGAPQAPLTLTRVSPMQPRCHWNLAPCRNGTGAYRIVAAQNNAMMLVTEGEGLADGTRLQIWKGKPESKGTWWYLELVDGMALQSADIGKAGKP